MEKTWHYKDEKTGQRLGPVDQDEIARLITDGRVERGTVVWNAQMADWAKASTTDLASMFGSTPPPLPAAEISRWALYTVAFLPFWGVLVQAAISSQTSTPHEVYDSHAWIFFFLVGNGLLGWLDERNLERAGLQLKGATVLSALLVPAYIYISCRTYKRHTEASTWVAYAPVFIWIVALLIAGNMPDYWFDQ